MLVLHADFMFLKVDSFTLMAVKNTVCWDVSRHCILLSITNKMQRYTIFFITVNALHVSGSFSAHHQELKTVHTASGMYQACLLVPLAWVSSNSPMLVVAASKLDT